MSPTNLLHQKHPTGFHRCQHVIMHESLQTSQENRRRTEAKINDENHLNNRFHPLENENFDIIILK